MYNIMLNEKLKKKLFQKWTIFINAMKNYCKDSMVNNNRTHFLHIVKKIKTQNLLDTAKVSKHQLAAIST